MLKPFHLNLVLIVFLISCNKNNPANQQDPDKIMVEPSQINFSFDSDLDSILVNSEVTWHAEFDSAQNPWLTLQPSVGTGNAKIYLRTSMNLTDSIRQTILNIKAVDNENITPVKIIITQLAADPNYRNAFGGRESEGFSSAVLVDDDAIVAIGSSSSSNGDLQHNMGWEDIWVVKARKNGEIIWQKNFGGSGRDYGNNILKVDNGCFIISGYSNSSDGNMTGNHGDFDQWVAKIDNNGEIIWSKMIGGSAFDASWSITKSTDGGYFSAGQSNSKNGDVGSSGSNMGWITKLDANGDIIWSKLIGGDELLAVESTNDGGCIAAGRASLIPGLSPLGSFDGRLVKLDNMGAIQWQKLYGGEEFDGISDIVQLSNGDIIFTGYTSSSSLSHGLKEENAWLARVSSTGNLIWQKVIGGTQIDVFAKLLLTSDNRLLVVGRSQSADIDLQQYRGDWDAWVAEFTLEGDLIEQRFYGGSKAEYGVDILELDKDKYFLIGSTISTDRDIVGQHGYQDGWVFPFNWF